MVDITVIQLAYNITFYVGVATQLYLAAFSTKSSVVGLHVTC